jgi:hypothetical protein
MYGNKKVLEEDMRQVFNADMVLKDLSKEIGECIIVIEDSLRTPTQYLEEERVKRKIMSKIVSPET